MSVSLRDQHRDSLCDLANGEWKALTAIGCFMEGEHKVPLWNGCHDEQPYTRKQIALIVKRLKQLHSHVLELEGIAEGPFDVIVT